MSFQSYLDNVEKQTGKTPDDFIIPAKEKGFGPGRKPAKKIHTVTRVIRCGLTG